MKGFLQDRSGNLSSTRVGLLICVLTGCFMAAGPTAANIVAGVQVHETVDPFLVLSVLAAGMGSKVFQSAVESREGKA